MLGIVGIVLAIVFFWLGRREKKPLWSVKNNNLIRGFSKQLPDLNVTYKDQAVENLSVTKLVFWNAGAETIRVDDIADADALSILPLNQARLLDVKIAEHNSAASQFLIPTTEDMAAAFIHFDFVDKNQGVVVQVIHTGTSAEDICLKGTIKGAGNPARNELSRSLPMTLGLGAAAISVPPAIAIGGLLFVGESTSDEYQWWIANATIPLLLMAYAYVFPRLLKYGLRRIPKQLRSHFS